MTEGLTIKDKLEQLGLTEERVTMMIFDWFEKYHDGEFKIGPDYTFGWLDTGEVKVVFLARAILSLATDKPYA